MRALTIAFLCATVVGCGSGASVETEAELASQVSLLVQPNSTAESAQATLAKHGFICGADSTGQILCRRNVAGLVCNQLQFVFLPKSSVEVGSIKTKLDSVCL